MTRTKINIGATEIVAADVAVTAPPAEIAAQVGRLFEAKVAGTTVDFGPKRVRFRSAGTERHGLVGVDLTAADRGARGRSATIANMTWRLV